MKKNGSDAKTEKNSRARTNKPARAIQVVSKQLLTYATKTGTKKRIYPILRIRPSLLEKAGMTPGSAVTITVKQDVITIRRAMNNG